MASSNGQSNAPSGPPTMFTPNGPAQTIQILPKAFPTQSSELQQIGGVFTNSYEPTPGAEPLGAHQERKTTVHEKVHYFLSIFIVFNFDSGHWTLPIY